MQFVFCDAKDLEMHKFEIGAVIVVRVLWSMLVSANLGKKKE